jgi:hypothetical protein
LDYQLVYGVEVDLEKERVLNSNCGYNYLWFCTATFSMALEDITDVIKIRSG